MAQEKCCSKRYACSDLWLYDMHCHLDFAQYPHALACALAKLGVRCFSVTVTPKDYVRACRLIKTCDNVRIGLGLHPWWVEELPPDGGKMFEYFENLLSHTYFVGEVGLDFGSVHCRTRDVQYAVFNRILAACAQSECKKIISIHAVHAADAVLDILEHYDITTRHTCIFHWFSGSSDDLQRAIRQGCYFSVGPRMAASKRGQAYVRAVPSDRLLLETDSPSKKGEIVRAQTVYDRLSDVLCAIARIRRTDVENIKQQIAQTGKNLFERLL